MIDAAFLAQDIYLYFHFGNNNNDNIILMFCKRPVEKRKCLDNELQSSELEGKMQILILSVLH